MITLGTVAAAGFTQKVTVLSAVAVLMTVAVYGLVAGIVRLDDWGLRLLHGAQTTGGAARRALGRFLLVFSPALLKFLSVAGTVAMFLVGGSILSHGLAPVHHWVSETTQAWSAAGGVGALAAVLLPFVSDLLVGVCAGIAALILVTALGKLRQALR